MVQRQTVIPNEVKLCVISNQLVAVIYHAPLLILPSSGLWEGRPTCFKLLTAARQRWYIFTSFVWVLCMYSIYKYQSCFLHIRGQGPALEKEKKNPTPATRLSLQRILRGCCHGNGISCWLCAKRAEEVYGQSQQWGRTSSILVRESGNMQISTQRLIIHTSVKNEPH